MFRLGGDVRRNYQNGTDLSDIENLMKQRAELRQKRFATERSLLPFSVLAGQMDDIRTIRKPGDVLNILSNIGGSPELMGALAKLPAIDLKKTEGELSDKITLAKLRASKNKKFEFEKRLEIASGIERKQGELLAGKSDAERRQIMGSTQYRNLEKQKNSVLREMSEKEYLYQRSIKDGNLFDIDEAKKDYDIISGKFAEGGRVGYQEGTPEPMMQQPMMQQPMMQETMQPEAPKENAMSVKQMYDLMRQRIPVANVSDKDLYKIASSEQIMADFASLETMSDVTQFNEQYDTNIVLDLPIVG